MCKGLEHFKVVIGMEINQHKYSMVLTNLEEVETEFLVTQLPLQVWDLNEGFKYLGFFFKPNDYRKND